LGDILRVKKVNQFKASADPVPVACPSLLQGLELEIEHCEEMDDSWRMNGITIHEDGSLRNTGREFITAPATLSVTAKLLNSFFVPGRFTARNYSERCSVHVHCNCQNLTPEQLAGVLLLYQMTEDLLFDFVGEDRRDNIFCVPWSQTNLSYNAVGSILTKGPQAVKTWQKYTALNLAPLFTLGTIEFRQMHGTSDVTKILNWCNIIGCLFEYAQQNSLDTIIKWVKTLNTSSEYRSVLDSVFRQWADLLRSDGFERKIAEGVLNTKYLLMQPEKPAKKTITQYYNESPTIIPQDVFEQPVAQVRARRPVPLSVQDALNEMHNWVIQGSGGPFRIETTAPEITVDYDAENPF